MPTVAEILKQTGLSDEQIAALDPKATEAFTKVLSDATSTLEQAELAKRAVSQKWDTEISPALDAWANEKAQLTARESYYKALAEKAKEGGFLPGDAPFQPPAAPAPRDANGKFVAGANEVPGSPGLVENFRKEAGAAIGSMLDLTWKYQTLYGRPMPDSPTALISEANAQRMDPISYAAKKYNFAGKEAEMKAQEQKEREEAIRKEEREAVQKEFTERYGNNPMLRQAETSKFSSLDKAVKSGERPDPLKMTREERHASTRNLINKEIASNAVN